MRDIQGVLASRPLLPRLAILTSGPGHRYGFNARVGRDAEEGTKVIFVNKQVNNDSCADMGHFCPFAMCMYSNPFCRHGNVGYGEISSLARVHRTA